MEIQNKQHVFEIAGLGKAPFKLVYVEDVYFQEIRMAIHGIPRGSCDYCSTAITTLFYIDSADGKRFHVGCECVKKISDRGLIEINPITQYS